MRNGKPGTAGVFATTLMGLNKFCMERIAENHQDTQEFKHYINAIANLSSRRSEQKLMLNNK
jgi:hypothetical protein